MMVQGSQVSPPFPCEPFSFERSDAKYVDGRDRVFAVKDAAAVFGQADFGTGDLPFTRFAPELPEYLADLGNPSRADRMTLGQEATTRIDRTAAAKLGHAIVNEFPAPARLAQTQLLIHQQFGRRGGVVGLNHLEIVRPKPSLLVRLAGD